MKWLKWKQTSADGETVKLLVLMFLLVPLYTVESGKTVGGNYSLWSQRARQHVLITRDEEIGVLHTSALSHNFVLSITLILGWSFSLPVNLISFCCLADLNEDCSLSGKFVRAEHCLAFMYCSCFNKINKRVDFKYKYRPFTFSIKWSLCLLGFFVQFLEACRINPLNSEKIGSVKSCPTVSHLSREGDATEKCTEKNKNTDLFTNQESKADILTEKCSVSKTPQEWKLKAPHTVLFIHSHPFNTRKIEVREKMSPSLNSQWAPH